MLLAGELRSRSSSCSEEEVLAVSESAGRMRYRQLCELQPAVNNGVISHGPTLWAYCSSCCHLTWPDICSPDTSRENNRRVHLSLVCPRRGLVTGACFQEGGKCPVPAPTVQILRHSLCQYVAASHVSPAQLRFVCGLLFAASCIESQKITIKLRYLAAFIIFHGGCAVLWRCWLGSRKGIRPVKKWVMGYWRGYLSGVRCKLAYDQLMPLPLAVSCFSKVQIGFTFLVPAHPGTPGKRAVKWV